MYNHIYKVIVLHIRKCNKNTIRELYYKKALPSKCATMMNKVLFIIYYSKIVNTGHHSCMFSVVYNNIQKITNISIKKPIILISTLNKYLDIPIYLDHLTPIEKTKTHLIQQLWH